MRTSLEHAPKEMPFTTKVAGFGAQTMLGYSLAKLVQSQKEEARFSYLERIKTSSKGTSGG